METNITSHMASEQIRSDLHVNAFISQLTCRQINTSPHFTKNSIMKKLLHSSAAISIAVVLLLLAFSSNAATISSTTLGGQWTSAGTWVGGVVPGAADDVIIKNGAAVSVAINAVCSNLTISAGNANTQVIITDAASSLTVTGTLLVNAPNADNITKVINVGNGVLICGNLTMANTANSTRTCQIIVDAGSVTVSGAFLMNGVAAENKIVFNNNGTLNIGGSISGGDIDPTTSDCTVKYNGTAPQTVTMAAAYVYKNLILDNPSTTTLSAAINVTKLTGDLKVLQGTFSNGGFGIVATGLQSFEVADGATFQASGTSTAFPVTFGTIILGPASTVEYNGSANQTVADIASPGYGNLTLSNAGTKTVALEVLPNPGGLDVRGDVTLNTGITFALRTYIHNIAGNWINNGASLAGNHTVNFNGTIAKSITGSASNQTFFKLSFNNPAGITFNSAFTSTTSTITIGASGKLIIPSGKWATSTGNIINTAGAGPAGLVVESGASLIHPNNNVPATVKRNVTAWGGDLEGWHFLSSPVEAQPIATAFTTDGGGDYDFYLWDEPSQLWVNEKNTTVTPTFSGVNPGNNFVRGRGYMVAYSVAGDREFTGELNAADVVKSGLTLTSGGYNWHLLGNPYPCALIWNNTWTSVNVGGTCQIWDDQTGSYTPIPSTGGIIPAMNGFMVEVLANNASITIPKSGRNHASTSWYKQATSLNMIKLTAWAEDRKTAKQSLVISDPGSTTAFDPAIDGHYLSDYAPVFYSLAGDDKLSVNTLPEVGGDVRIPFAFAKNTSSNFSIELDIENVIPDLDIFLTDNKTGAVVNLSKNPVYQFSSANGDDINRFELSFLTTTGVTPVTENNGINAYVSDNTLHINQTKAQSGNVYLFSLTGQLISTNTLEASPSQNISLPQLAPGIYMVKIQTGTSNYTQKIVIK